MKGRMMKKAKGAKSLLAATPSVSLSLIILPFIVQLRSHLHDSAVDDSACFFRRKLTNEECPCECFILIVFPASAAT
jgi:hypothetical protein